MIRYVFMATLAASPAGADTVKEWGFGDVSRVEIHAPTAPNAVATVTFQNRMVHSHDDDFFLTFDGIEVGFRLIWGGRDREEETLLIYPPDGFVAVPPELDLRENVTDEAQIYLWEGM